MYEPGKYIEVVGRAGRQYEWVRYWTHYYCSRPHTQRINGWRWLTCNSHSTRQRPPHSRARVKTGQQTRNSQWHLPSTYQLPVHTRSPHIHVLNHGAIMRTHIIHTHVHEGGMQVDEGNKWWPESWHLQGWWVGQLHIPNITLQWVWVFLSWALRKHH